MSESKKNFLIRSAGQILGPYSKEEVVDLIKRGKISIFDEVAEPFTIWWYLQDHQEFKTVIHSMDVQTRLTNFLTQISDKILTISKTSKTDNKTSTITSDLKQNTESLFDGGPTITELDPQEKQSAVEVKIQVMDQKKKPESSHVRYTSQKDSEEIIRKKIRRVIKISWRVVIVCALSVGAYVFYKEIVSPLQQQKTVRVEFETYGLNFYKSGDYNSALPYFEMAYSKNVLQEKEKLWLASLFVQKNRLQKASLIADELSNSSLSDTGEWILLNGLIAFSQKDFQTAEKHFNSVLKQKESMALVNLSLLNWQLGKHEKSLSYLDRLARAGYERGIVFYLKALNLFFQNQISVLDSYINQELSFNQSSSLVKEYKQEFYFMMAYFYMIKQQPKKMEDTIRKLLNEDPFFWEEYQYNSFIAVKSLNWSQLYPYCKNLFDFDPKNNLLNALYGFCHLKIRNFKQGTKYIQRAKNSAAQEPLFLSLYAYLLMLEGKDVELEQVLSLIDYNDLKQPLPYILKARFFEREQNWVRALTVWKDLLSFSARHLSGLAGVAVANYQLGDHSTAEVYRNKGLNEYHYYVRLLSYGNKDF